MLRTISKVYLINCTSMLRNTLSRRLKTAIIILVPRQKLFLFILKKKKSNTDLIIYKSELNQFVKKLS